MNCASHSGRTSSSPSGYRARATVRRALPLILTPRLLGKKMEHYGDPNLTPDRIPACAPNISTAHMFLSAPWCVFDGGVGDQEGSFRQVAVAADHHRAVYYRVRDGYRLLAVFPSIFEV
ncbi:unnamed protein product [Ilex paraguariensis]|uniref:Uncharacterized protein n=1 Tax=Ilex paraguariensis TaxID=185542 RepID=A0ABC8S4A6_9AQUA